MLEVELPCGLVGQQDRVAGGEGAGDRHALLLAARELVREVLVPVAEPDLVERRGGDLPVVAAGDVGAELHVLERRQRREEVERLEDEGHRLAAEARRAPSARRR